MRRNPVVSEVLSPGAVLASPDDAAGRARRGACRRARRGRALFWTRLERRAPVLDRRDGAPARRDRLDPPARGADRVGARLHLAAGRARRLAGDLDPLVDRAGALLGLLEPRARLPRVRGGRHAPRRRAAGADRGDARGAARPVVRGRACGEGRAGLLRGLRTARPAPLSPGVLERARIARGGRRAAGSVARRAPPRRGSAFALRGFRHGRAHVLALWNRACRPRGDRLGRPRPRPARLLSRARRRGAGCRDRRGYRLRAARDRE